MFLNENMNPCFSRDYSVADVTECFVHFEYILFIYISGQYE